MKIGLIGNLAPGAKVEDLQGYNQVMTWHIRRALDELGHEAILIPDGLLPDMPEVDFAVAFSAYILRKLAGKDQLPGMLAAEGLRGRETPKDANETLFGTELVKQVRQRCKALFWASDGPIRSIIPWGGGKIDGEYIGMGINPEVCYPEQDRQNPVVLFNAWNALVDQRKWDDPLMLLQLQAAEFCAKNGIEVHWLNLKGAGATKLIGKDLDPEGKDPGNFKLGYVKWLEICAAYRKGWVFCDSTPKVIELGRVEAAACGNTLVVPGLPGCYSTDPREGLHYLPQIYWETSTNANAVGLQIVLAIEAIRQGGTGGAEDRVRAYFTWQNVARRMIGFLAGYRAPQIAVSQAQSAQAEALGPVGSKDSPWVAYPLHVPPAALWWIHGDAGAERLGNSVHAHSAKEILAGAAPEDTEYAKCIRTKQAGCHGKPEKFAALIRDMKAKGWHGGPIIGFIVGDGRIIIHDGFHRSAAALAVGLSTVPVAIHGRDPSWIAFRIALKKLNGGCKLYQPIDHPDLSYWRSWRKDTAQRIKLIVEALRSNSVRTVCDLGCHSGVLSCALARAGYDVTGIDSNPKAIAAARRMAAMEGIGGDAAFHAGSEPDSAEAVICLSALNHAWVKGKGDELFAKLAAAAPLLILDMPALGDPVGGDTEWADENHVVKWLEDKGGAVEYLGKRGEGNLQRTLLRWRRVEPRKRPTGKII